MFVDKKMTKNILSSIVNIVGNANPALYQNALFWFDENGYSVFATDTRRNFWINQPDIHRDNLLLNPSLLLSSFSGEGQLDLSIGKSQAVTIHDGKRKTKINSIDKSNFLDPKLFHFGQKIMKLDELRNIKKLLQFHLAATQNATDKLFLSAFRFEISNGMNIVTLDGTKLIYSSVPMAIDTNTVFMVNAKEFLGAIDVFLSLPFIYISYNQDETSIYLYDEACKFVIEVPLLTDNYPDYQKLLSKKELSNLSVNTDEFLTAIDACSKFSDTLNLVIRDNEMIISSNSEEGETMISLTVHNPDKIDFEKTFSNNVLSALYNAPFVAKDMLFQYGNPYLIFYADIWRLIVFPTAK